VTELYTSRCLPVLSPPPPHTVTLRVMTAGSVTTANAEQLADFTRDCDVDEDPEEEESEKLKSVSWMV